MVGKHTNSGRHKLPAPLTVGIVALINGQFVSALSTFTYAALHLNLPTCLCLFQAIQLLFGLRSGEETAARTPLWLLILRSLIVATVILALSQPILNPNTTLIGNGTVLLVIDDGWAAAENWQMRRQTLLNLIDQAEREERAVAILTTALPADGAPASLRGVGTAEEARKRVQGLQPKPWPVDRAAAAAAICGMRKPVSSAT